MSRARTPQLEKSVLAATTSSRLYLPFFGSRIPAGFPSPADDYVENKLDLNEYLVSHKEATFFLQVQGDSMIGAGIHDGDLIVVDRSLNPAHKKIVVAVVDGELTVKRLLLNKRKTLLVPENPHYKAIEITDEQSFQIWGVITSVIHRL